MAEVRNLRYLLYKIPTVTEVLQKQRTNSKEQLVGSKKRVLQFVICYLLSHPMYSILSI